MFDFIKRIFNYWTPVDEEAEVDSAMSESSQASLEFGESQRDSIVANGNSELLESFSVTAETTTTTTETAMELNGEAPGILSPSQRAVSNSTTDVEAATTSALTDEAPKKRGRPKKEVTLVDDAAPTKKQRKETTVKEKHIAMATIVKNEPMDTAPHLEGADSGQLHNSSSGQPLKHVDVSQQAANSNVLQQTNSNVPQQTNSNVPQQTNSNAPRPKYSKIAPQQKANQHVFRAVNLEPTWPQPTWPQMYYRFEAPTQPQVPTIVEAPTQSQVPTTVEEPAQPKATRKRKSQSERVLELTRKRPSRSRAHKLGEHQCLVCGSTFATLEDRDSHAEQDHPADHTWRH
ncbi:hypothetical protein [Absidia glauca]|uniref:C2H2-type domain-containing protein n=1 Tax=Absidia glauca TaxID=4829 RepID=A0A163IVG2_ABSGL|nr:hypothetical protein [Absidia glauca]